MALILGVFMGVLPNGVRPLHCLIRPIHTVLDVFALVFYYVNLDMFTLVF